MPAERCPQTYAPKNGVGGRLFALGFEPDPVEIRLSDDDSFFDVLGIPSASEVIVKRITRTDTGTFKSFSDSVRESIAVFDVSNRESPRRISDWICPEDHRPWSVFTSPRGSHALLVFGHRHATRPDGQIGLPSTLIWIERGNGKWIPVGRAETAVFDSCCMSGDGRRVLLVGNELRLLTVGGESKSICELNDAQRGFEVSRCAFDGCGFAVSFVRRTNSPEEDRPGMRLLHFDGEGTVDWSRSHPYRQLLLSPWVGDNRLHALSGADQFKLIDPTDGSTVFMRQGPRAGLLGLHHPAGVVVENTGFDKPEWIDIE